MIPVDISIRNVTIEYDVQEATLKLSFRKKRDPFKDCWHGSLKISGGIGRSLNSPSTLYIYPSILVPCARRPTPSLSHSLARGMLAHSSSTPVASTTIQSRSTRHAASFVEYVCATISLFFPSFRLCFFSSSTLTSLSPFSYHVCTSISFFSIFFSLFRSRFILIKSLFFKKIIMVLL